MSIIAIVGNKGGAGKTTLSVNIASGINKRFRTAIIDADPQRSSLQWRAFSEDDAVSVYEAEEELAPQANQLKEQYERIIIDCPHRFMRRKPTKRLKCVLTQSFLCSLPQWIYGQLSIL